MPDIDVKPDIEGIELELNRAHSVLSDVGLTHSKSRSKRVSVPDVLNPSIKGVKVPKKDAEAPSAYRQFKLAAPEDRRVIAAECDRYLADEDAAIAGGALAHTRWKLAVFMEAPKIRAFFISLVILNGILIGVQIDHGGDETAWDTVDLVFLSVFSIEVALRLFAFSWIFFSDPWNILDFLVVVAGILDTIISSATGKTSTAFSVFRLLRIFRIIRIMGFFQRLSTLVEAFFGAMKDVIWVALLVLMMLYIFGVMVTSFYSDRTELDEGGVDSNDLFGTVPRSMATLFQIMTMDGWMSGIVRPMGNVYPSAWFVMIVWVIVGALGLLNLLTAIFIESLQELSREANDLHKAMQSKKRKELLEIIQKLFLKFDTDFSGTLDIEESNHALAEIESNPEILKAFSDLGIKSEHISEAIQIADTDGNGIEYHEFLQCLSIMDESSQKKDTMRLSKQLHELMNEVSELRRDLQLHKNQKTNSSAPAPAPAPEIRFRQLFNEVDTSENGEIDNEELLRIFSKFAPDLNEDDADSSSATELTSAMIAEYGSNGVLKFDQFERMMQEHDFESVFSS